MTLMVSFKDKGKGGQDEGLLDTHNTCRPQTWPLMCQAYVPIAHKDGNL